MHLRQIDSEQRKHAVLAPDAAKIALGTCRAQMLDEFAAQSRHARAHRADFIEPRRTLRIIAQDFVHDGGTVVGRHRINGAGDAGELTQRRIGSRRGCGDNVQRTGAFAIQSEVLRARYRDQDFRQLRGEQTYAECILGDTAAQSLICHIDERQERAAFENGQELAPLRVGEIRAGGVMATCLQQHDTARGQPPESFQHDTEVESAARGVVVGVVCKLEARAANERDVIGPGGSADMHDGSRGKGLDQLRAEAQRAAASRRLNGAHAAAGKRRMRGTEGQLLERAVESGIADG